MASLKLNLAPGDARRLLFFSLLFLGSGAAGLIYQIAWERLLELYFGVTLTAITLIVAAYMAGLGLGSLYGGRVAGKQINALLLYGLLELGIGLFGFFSPALILKVGQATAGSPYWLVFVLSFLLLLVPTFLMGMTLPLLSQAFIHRVETSGQIIGILYGINTIGAAVGTLAAGYLLIGAFGLDGSINFAFALNAVIGLLAALASRQKAIPTTQLLKTISEKYAPGGVPREASPKGGAAEDNSESNFKQTEEQQKPDPTWGYLRILSASFLVGFIGLGYEMLWIRVLSIVNKNTVYNFPSILFVFLLGLAAGGYVWGRQADRSFRIERLFWRVEIGVGLVAALTFFIFWSSLSQNWAFNWLGDFWQMQKPLPPLVEVDGAFVFSRRALLNSLAHYFLPILILVLPSSFLMGGGLPVLDRIAIYNPEVAGRRIGDIHLANITGSVFGSLAISFVLLPSIGSEWTLKVLVLLSFVFPLLFMKRGVEQKSQLRARAYSTALIVSAGALLLLLPGQGQFYARLFETGTGKETLVDESGETILALTLNAETNQPDWLWISGETNSFYPTDGTYESRALTCAGASHPKRILVIGMGGGITAHFFQSIPGIEKVVIVELMDELDNFLYENVRFNQETIDSPLVEYIVDDGRRYLHANPGEQFDLIYADPLRWYSSGHNNLYSYEAMQLYKAHLVEGGVFCAYVDQPNVIPKTINGVFPHIDQFRFRTVVASASPILYDLAYMQTLVSNYTAVAGKYIDAKTAETIQPRNLLAQFSRSHEQVVVEEKDFDLLTDTNPWLEYYLFNMPQRRPVWPKGDARQEFTQRIVQCDSECQANFPAQTDQETEEQP
jgi:predicted membrane-bound spermidine synthase